MECSSLVNSCCSIHCTTEIITANLNTLTEVKFNTLKERISNLLKNLLTLPEEVSSVAQANKHLVDLPTSYVHDNCIYYHLSCFKKITHTRYQCPAVSTSLLVLAPLQRGQQHNLLQVCILRLLR